MPDYYNKPASANQPDSIDYDLEEEKKIVAEETEKIKKELIDKWQRRYADAVVFPEKIKKIDPEITNFLLSFQTTLFYDDLARTLKFDKNQRDLLPHLIWHTCLNKKWDEFSGILTKELKVSDEIAVKVNDLVSKNIFSKFQNLPAKRTPLSESISKKDRVESPKISLSFSEMLKKYPEINDQLITSDSIKLINSSELARPTLKNWINDYTLRHGYKKHTTVERGSFLFQSENGRKLSPPERERLSQIIKSFDQESEITVDTSTKRILFQSESDIKNISVVSKDKK
jgi:hypothetical protein